MSKNLIIAFLVAVSVLSLSYGYVQKLHSNELEKLVLEWRTRAAENEKMAVEQRVLAESSRAEAEFQRALALTLKEQADAAAKKAKEAANKRN